MKTNVVKDLILVMIILGLAFSGWQIWQHSTQTAKIQEVKLEKESMEETELLQKIRKMENSIAARRNFELNLASDPMELKAFMKDQKAENLEKILALRLTATILGERPAAVFFWQGQNYRVGLNERFEGHQVLRIETNKAVVRQPNGQVITLVTAPQPDMTEAQKQLNDRGKKFDEY